MCCLWSVLRYTPEMWIFSKAEQNKMFLKYGAKKEARDF